MRRWTFATVMFVLGASAASASAQVPTVDPSGAPPAPAPAPQPAQPAPQPAQPIVIPLQPGQLPPGSGEPVEDTGYYYLPDDLQPGGGMGNGGSVGNGAPPPGLVPPYHDVRSGDTLWDICFYYFNNPWEWPRIWSYNPKITNPHWIYPGDRVQLYAEGQGPTLSEPQPVGQAGGQPSTVEDTEPVEEIDAPPSPLPAQGNVKLRQLAFVDEDTRKHEFTVVGAVEEKSLLAEGDSIYVDYPAGRPPKVGQRYAIYTETQAVSNPDTGKKVGSVVRVIGELEIASVAKGKRARAVITDSTDVIERGARVGPLQRTFRTVEPKRAEADVRGTIVATLADELIGQGQVVFIDQGESSGLKVGNRMYVVRRGDAFGESLVKGYNVGQDDRRFPERAIGEILVVQTGKSASTALVTLALQEIGVGDRVLVNKARK